MLEIPSMLLSDEKANEIVCKFINDRLIGIMESVIMSWLFDESFVDDEDTEPVKTVIDVPVLMQNRKFAKEVSLNYLPHDFPTAKANAMFLGLYKILKAKDALVPELEMEYALFHLIQEEIDNIHFYGVIELSERPLISFEELKAREDAETGSWIPFEDREVVKKAIVEELKDEYAEEDLDEVAEDYLLYYEDLERYDETCFGDVDFMLLDMITSEEITGSKLNETMGIVLQSKSNIIEFPRKSVE